MGLVYRTRVLSQRCCLPAIRRAIACVFAVGGLIFAAQPAAAQYLQQGSKLVGSGAVGAAEQGYALALSGDGNTFAEGGPADATSTGAVWVYTRTGGAWTQQGLKFSGTGATGAASQGSSVAISADGNTLIVGGPNDSANAGAAWVFVRSGGVWTQQGSKLVGMGAVGPAYQGTSVALSADGTIAIIGGPNDNAGVGAVWVFTRSGGIWSQAGSKLVGSNPAGPAAEGTSVALSADSSTLIVGGPNDNASGVGSAWIFTQSGGVWSQQGSKLVSGGRGGTAVALSPDGNTAVVAGPQINGSNARGSFFGGAFIFTRTGGVWTKQGGVLGNGGSSVVLSPDGTTVIQGSPGSEPSVGRAFVFKRIGVWSEFTSQIIGAGEVGPSGQGWSIALSADDKTALSGGPQDNAGAGAVWVFNLHNAAATHDFNGDGKSDILWRDTSGDVAMWLMNGGSLLQAAALGSVTGTLEIIGQHDFDGDGNADLLWRDGPGNLSMWFMNGTSVASAQAVSHLPSNWNVYGAGDLSGDFTGDLLWRESVSGSASAWIMIGSQVASTAGLGTLSSDWSIIGDDNNGNIFWRNTAGDLAIWQINGVQEVATRLSLGNVPANFVIQGLGDFNGDGQTDILWRDTNTGALSIWFLNGTQVTSSAAVGILASSWNVAQIGDYDGDGKSDILFLDTSGDVAMWLMNGATVSSSIGIGNVGTTWQVQNVNAN